MAKKENLTEEQLVNEAFKLKNKRKKIREKEIEIAKQLYEIQQNKKQ